MFRLFYFLIFLFLPFLSHSSTSSSGQYLAAKVAERGLDTTNASLFYQRALELDSETDFLRFQAFRSFVLNGDFDLSVDLADDIVTNRLDASMDIYELSLLVLATDYIKRGLYSDALLILNHNWNQQINNLLGGIISSWSLSGLSRFDESLDVLSSLEGPIWFDLFRDYHSGLILLSSGRTDQGIDYLRRAFKNSAAGRGAEDTYIRIINFLSLSLASTGDIESGLSIAREALRFRPRHPNTHALFDTLESGDISVPLFTPILGVSEIYLNLGSAVNREGGEQFSRSFFQLGNYLYPDSPQLIMELALIYERSGLLTQANEFYHRIPSSSALWSLSRLQIATNLDELGEYEESRILFDELLKNSNGDSLPLLTLVNLNAHHQRFADSIPLLQDYITTLGTDITPSDWRLFYRLGIAYERTDRWSDAEPHFRRALELNPESSDVLNYLGYSWVDMGINLEEGLSLIMRAVTLSPSDGYMIDSLGWAYYRLGNFPDAVTQLEKALSLRPADPTINDHLGDAYWQVGRTLEAKYQWRHALSFEPPKPEDILRIKEKLKNGLTESTSEVSIKP